MGIYLNPENENFRRTIASEIYVDKTMMIEVTNRMLDTDSNLICMSRPRRFGKTIASEMLSAYYSKGCDSSALFEPLKIAGAADYRDKLNKYNVIKIDLNSEYQSVEDKDKLILVLTREIRREMVRAFPDAGIEDDDSLARSILRVYEKTGETFIILIDEYDVLVREEVNGELFNVFLSFLNGLFKSATLRPAISLAYLTGILPIVRDKVQSKLNNFDEYTILDAGEFAEFVGFTPDEVKALSKEYGMDYEECRRWYDGYRQHGYDIYNPESVVKAMTTGEYDVYWNRTSTYEAVAERIRMNFEGTRDAVIRMLAGESVDVNVTRFMNTMDSFRSSDDVFTYLIYLGYLAYDKKEKTCRIPNHEIQLEWQNAVETEPEYKVTNSIIKGSKELLKATIAGDGEAVAKALDVSHMHVASNRNYNNEDVFQSAIYLAYIYALNKYTIIKEMTAGRGFADVVFIPFVSGLPAMVIELKHNKTAESALDQIKEKKYFDSLEAFSGEILLVGINYNEAAKEHTCKIEKVVKVNQGTVL